MVTCAPIAACINGTINTRPTSQCGRLGGTVAEFLTTKDAKYAEGGLVEEGAEDRARLERNQQRYAAAAGV